MLSRPLLSCALTTLLAAATCAQTAPATQPASQPAPQAAEKQATGDTPSSTDTVASSAAIPDAVKPLLDQMGKAYTDAKSLTLAGKLSLDFDAGGDQKHESADFTANFVAPNLFRHEVKDDLLIVSTGEKAFAYLPAKNEYIAVESPKEKVASKDIPGSIAQLLTSQNPVLLLAIASDPIEQLLSGASKVAQAEDVKLADISYSAITFERNDRGYRVLLDPATHLIRQIRIDRRAEVQKRGVEDVKTADVTFDYLLTKLTDAPAPEQFTWTPPRDATLAKEETPNAAAGGSASILEGKPAPDFKLAGIDGTSVSLADLKGKVVVLDFWATWCGPCVASLPHIDQINTDLSEKGLKVFAINLEEPKAAVQKFVITKKLTLPVLLDTDGATGKKYLANAIPETVIIGKDGSVKKVFIGFGGDEALRAAIEVEMNK